jgi:hypothetical protein
MKNALRSLYTSKLLMLAATLGFQSMTTSFAQGRLVDSRDQAEGWYVPVIGQVLVSGKGDPDCTVEIFRDNKTLGQVPVQKKGRFEVNLDLDQQYTILVRKDGHATKLIHVDTTLPKEQVTYPAYECYIALVPRSSGAGTGFYDDFPSAIVRWDPELRGFHHSEDYMAHLQERLMNMARVER